MPPVVQFSASTATVSEDGGNAMVTVTKTGATAVAATVHFATSNGSATAGQDYTATSGDLTFAANETSKQISVPITNDSSLEGDENFTVTLSNPSDATLGSVTSATVTIEEDDAPAAITSANSATFVVGASGTFTVNATGNPTPAITRSGDALPSGVTFVDNGDGTATLSGGPVAGTGGVYNFTFTASNGVGPDATQSFTLTVNEAPAFTSAGNATFTVGEAGSFQMTASGFPAPTFSTSSALPNGVSLSAAGLLSGTPMAGTGGVYNLTVTASNSAGADATQSFTLTVNQAPSITSANGATFTEGNFGSFTVEASGYPAPTFSASGALPSGVTFVGGVLSGAPAEGTGGSYPIEVTASNGVGNDATQTFTLTVEAAVCVAPPTDLLAWFPAEGDASDAEFGIHGSALTGAGFAAGKVNQGFTFDGASAVVEVPDDPAWAFGANAFTVQTWVRFDAISGSDVLVGQSEGSGNLNKWLFWLKNGRLEFHLNGTASANITSDATFAPTLGRWYHVAVTRSGNTYRFYVDGAQNGGDRLDANAVPDVNAPLTFGKAEAFNALNGMLDEVQIFSRALSGAEVASVYGASLEGLCFDLPQAASAVSRKVHGARRHLRCAAAVKWRAGSRMPQRRRQRRAHDRAHVQQRHHERDRKRQRRECERQPNVERPRDDHPIDRRRERTGDHRNANRRGRRLRPNPRQCHRADASPVRRREREQSRQRDRHRAGQSALRHQPGRCEQLPRRPDGGRFDQLERRRDGKASRRDGGAIAPGAESARRLRFGGAARLVVTPASRPLGRRSRRDSDRRRRYRSAPRLARISLPVSMRPDRRRARECRADPTCPR